LAKGLRLEDVAGRLGVAPSTLSRIETGKAPTRTSYLTLLLDIYGVTDTGHRRQLSDSAREGQRKGWWADSNDLLSVNTRHYLSLEPAATRICAYAPELIPDLLQAPDYALAAIRATRPGIRPNPARQLAAITSRRQDILRRDGFSLHAVIDESALRTTIGSSDVMAGQIRHLAEVAATPAVTVQVLPMATTKPVLCAPATLLGFPADPDIACTGGACGPIAFCDNASARTTKDAFARLANAALPADESARLISTLANRPYRELSKPSKDC
jgi:transcriptional regulator with XRE-family HTH domain